MDKRKLQLIQHLLRLKSEAIEAGLTLEKVENALLLECSEEARDRRRSAEITLTQSSSGTSDQKSAGSHIAISSTSKHRVLFLSALAVVIAMICIHGSGLVGSLLTSLQQSECILHVNEFTMEISRPVDSCQMCAGMSHFPTYLDIEPAEFLEKHAYTGRPALILEGGTRNWAALDSFSFQFFRDLYLHTDNALESQEECQFFPYNTDFETFEEFLNMSDERADMKAEQWYVGWSNCDSAVSIELRRHYSLPHFLPEGAESSAVDWIFMGGPGRGANVHIDNVDRPSWQAQISGSKTWTLIPPPECEHVCHEINATMSKGNVIIVDTNKWYHKTDVHPGGVSITIGSEYD